MIEYLPLMGVLLLALLTLCAAVLGLPILLYRASRLWTYGQLEARRRFELLNKPNDTHSKEKA